MGDDLTSEFLKLIREDHSRLRNVVEEMRNDRHTWQQEVKIAIDRLCHRIDSLEADRSGINDNRDAIKLINKRLEAYEQGVKLVKWMAGGIVTFFVFLEWALPYLKIFVKALSGPE